MWEVSNSHAKDDFAAEVVFDKNEWFKSQTWELPIEHKPLDPLQGRGTTVSLEDMKKDFESTQIERFIRERLPLNTPNFQVFLNGKLIKATIIPGKKFPILVETVYGKVEGELVLPNLQPKKSDSPGIECVVRGVVICRSTLGIQIALIQRLKGQISADFVPITSDRSRFITDSHEYKIFQKVMAQEVKKIAQQTQEEENKKEKKKNDLTLKNTLQRLQKAMNRNPDLAPPLTGSIEELNKDPSFFKSVPIAQERGESEDDDWAGAFQSLFEEDSRSPNNKGIDTQEGEEEGAPPAKRVKIKNREGREVTARKIKVGGVGITCTIESCGKSAPAAFTEGGIVYINQDHSLFKKQQAKGQDMLSFLLTYLLAQQVALLLSEGDIRKSFDIQDRLLTDSW